MQISSISTSTTGALGTNTADAVSSSSARGPSVSSAVQDTDTVILSDAALNAANADASPSTTDTSASASQSTVVTVGIWAGLTTTDAFQKNKDTFDTLTSVILDDTGKYSEDDQLSAYKGLWNLRVTGKLYGIDNSSKEIMDNALVNSSVGKLSNQIYGKMDAVFKQSLADGGTNLDTNFLNAFNSLSDYEKNVYFSVTINPTNYLGKHTYFSLEEYESKLVRDAQSSGSTTVSLADASSTSSSVVTGSTEAADKTQASSTTTSKVLSSADAALQLLQYAKAASDAYAKAQKDSASSVTSSVKSTSENADASHISLLRTSLLTEEIRRPIHSDTA